MVLRDNRVYHVEDLARFGVWYKSLLRGFPHVVVGFVGVWVAFDGRAILVATGPPGGGGSSKYVVRGTANDSAEFCWPAASPAIAFSHESGRHALAAMGIEDYHDS